MAEWSNATVCKTVALTGYLGSNPGPSTLRLARARSGQAYESIVRPE